MPAPLEIIVTNAGRAAIVNAQNTGTAPVTIAEIGLSGTAVVPLPGATALPSELKRISSIAGEVVADDTIHVTLTDGSGDAYSLRSIGLYLADGTLFALYGQAAPILEKTAQSIASLSIDIIFADIAAAALTFGNANFTNPPATTERQGVVELSTLTEAQAGIDALRALTPATAKAAILGWLLAQDGAGSGLDADLLDGQQGSYYANIIERLGYTPWGPNNDGSGSGLDADFLDGKDSTWFEDILGRLGFTPVNRAGDTMTGPLTTSGAPTVNLHAANKQYVDALVTAAALLAKLVTVDGSGSGLDADLLDGQHATAFAKLTGAIFSGGVGRTADFYMDVDASGPFITFKDGSSIKYDTAANLYQFLIANNVRLFVSSEGITIPANHSIKRNNAGKYPGYADGSIAGDKITRGTAAPTGGTDGDMHLQNSGGTLKVWTKYGTTWIST